jgi:hypothetical protein
MSLHLARLLCGEFWLRAIIHELAQSLILLRAERPHTKWRASVPELSDRRSSPFIGKRSFKYTRRNFEKTQ